MKPVAFAVQFQYPDSRRWATDSVHLTIGQAEATRDAVTWTLPVRVVALHVANVVSHGQEPRDRGQGGVA